MIKRPHWLAPLSRRDEALRRHHGLWPGRDGWYKTIAGRKRYIARPMPLADVVAILPARLAELAGRSPQDQSRLAVANTTLRELVEVFLAHLWQRHLSGTPRKLSRRTYDDYADVLARFVACVGADELAARAGPDWFTAFARTNAHRAATSRRRDAIYLTAFFNWAGPGRHSLGFFRQPVVFGPDFGRPTEHDMRNSLAQRSVCYTPEQFAEALMRVRDCPLLLAFGLLGLNCAFLPSDMTQLPMSAIDLESGLVEFPRPKTGIERRAVLMPETIYYLRRWLAVRPVPANDAADRLLLRADGRPYDQRRRSGPDARVNHGSTLASYWRQATDLPPRGLRTTFATYADDFADQRAVDVIMGHAASTIRSKHYVKRFEPDRLRAAIEHVWRKVVTLVPLPAEASSKVCAPAR